MCYLHYGGEIPALRTQYVVPLSPYIYTSILFKNICDNQVTQCNNGILNSNKHRNVERFWCLFW